MKITHKRRCQSLLAALIITICLSGSLNAQPEIKKDQTKTDARDTELLAKRQQWHDLLDQLGDEARALFPEKNRSYAVAEVADAYWNLDEAKSTDLFLLALKAAMSVEPAREASAAVRNVIGLAAKRRVALGKRLNQELDKERAKSGRFGTDSISAARDLLESDPNVAADLVAGIAPAGLSGDSAGVFILDLAERNLKASQDVYGAYLARAAADPTIPLNHMLWLAGYPFGYGETYGFSDRDLTRMVGMGGRNIPGLSGNPVLAQAFLKIVFADLQGTMTQAASLPPEQAAALNSLCLFTTMYLLPEVERYVPASAEAWWVIRQRASAGTAPAQRDLIEKQLQMIGNNRAAAKRKAETDQSTPDEPTASDLADIEKITGGCQRDVAYVKASLAFHGRKNETQALKVADRVDTQSLHDALLQYLYYDLALAGADDGNWADADKYAKKVESREQLELLTVKMADAALRQKNNTRAFELLSDTRRRANDLDDNDARAKVLLAASIVVARLDQAQIIELMSDAVKALNRGKDHNLDRLTVLRKIDLSCGSNSPNQFYGSQAQADRFNLLDALALASTLDSDGALVIARSIEDQTNRIRALASIARSATSKAIAPPRPAK